ncbi:MAG: hypothetical protein KJZ95_21505 [Caldilinea sp.]|nr:hypothetical protein [Caldilinea sp.]
MTKAVQFILPFKVIMEPIKGVLLATFKHDPEFETLESQLCDDPINGRGMRVLRFRRDGRVDIYWQPGVRVNLETFEIGAGVGDFVETTIEPALLTISERGVECDVAFVDAQGRRVSLRVSEDAPGKRPFSLLAPVGTNVQHPLMLFLVYMSRFDFVSRAGIVEGRIGARVLQPDAIPLPMHGRRVWLTRYANHPITVGRINPPMHQPVQVEMPAPGSLEIDGMTLTADAQGRLVRLSAGTPPQQVELGFSPGIMSLSQLADGDTIVGRWSVSIAGTPITGGRYRLARVGSRAAVELDVTEHWRSQDLPLGMTILTRLMSMFRTWPASYRWRGTVDLGAEPTLSGAWERKGKA